MKAIGLKMWKFQREYVAKAAYSADRFLLQSFVVFHCESVVTLWVESVVIWEQQQPS